MKILKHETKNKTCDNKNNNDEDISSHVNKNNY